MSINCEILMSIHKEYCDKIFSGEKSVEVRKSIPHKGLPFKVYVYETKNSGGSGLVIGHFVVDGFEYPFTHNNKYLSFISDKELNKYSNGKSLYGLHIGSYYKYPNPLSISDFDITRAPQSWRYVNEC